jgi:hypothetical protein
MSTHAARSPDAASSGFIVAPPRSSDSICGALRSAFGRQNDVPDDFAALLRQIDLAARRTPEA